MKEKKQLILASGSPRRRELMTMAGLQFTVLSSEVPEIVPENMPPEQQPEYLAALKAGAVLAEHEDALVVGSDTGVFLDGEMLGKPGSPEEAADMLRRLSGREHQVYTGVCLASAEKTESFTSVTRVEFYELSEEEIRTYVACGEPMDKAGAYGIQGRGCRLVKRIEGDYFTVMGLPIAEVVRRLERF